MVLIASLAGPAAGASAAALDYDIPNGHFYTQANGHGGDGGTGFAIVDDGTINFWKEFQRLGGVDALGYPISGRFVWDGFTVQATQKVVLQWRPEVKAAVFVNVYDRMHDLKQDDWLKAFRGIPPIVDWTSDTGLAFNQVVAKHLALLNASPAIKAKYNAAPGDPVQLYGLPMAPVTPDNAAKPNFYILRCQRAAIQLWAVDSPASGAHKGDVVVTNGGDETKIVGGNGIFPSGAPLTPGQPSGAPAGTPSGPSSTSGMRYAFAVHMYNGQESPVVNATKGAGFGWIKQQVEWRTIEGAPGQFNYGELDSIVNAASGSGINVLLSIAKAPTWASVGPSLPYPKNPSDLADFVTNMAAHYKGKVQAYEIWNEENFAVEVGPGQINPGNYVELLHAAHDAIKKVDPSIIVISGAPTPTEVNDPNIAIDDTTYLNQMYAYQNGAVKNYFDVLGAHAEAWANAPEENVAHHTQPNFSNDKSFYFRHLEDYRNVMVANGDGNKQIFETEFGYDSCPPPNPVPPGYEYCRNISEQQQAAYLVGAFNYAKQNYPWLGMIAIWNLNFQAQVGPADEKWGWGVMRGDFTPRPAYSALQAMPKG